MVFIMISLAEWRIRIGVFLQTVRIRSSNKSTTTDHSASSTRELNVLHWFFVISVLFLLLSGDIHLNPGPKGIMHARSSYMHALYTHLI